MPWADPTAFKRPAKEAALDTQESCSDARRFPVQPAGRSRITLALVSPQT